MVFLGISVTQWEELGLALLIVAGGVLLGRLLLLTLRSLARAWS